MVLQVHNSSSYVPRTVESLPYMTPVFGVSCYEMINRTGDKLLGD